MGRCSKDRAFAFLACVFVGCASGTPMREPDAGGPFRCASDEDCDDGAACTIDACGVTGTCEFTPVNERCPAGQTCVAGRGCVEGRTCTTTADCDDSIACTIDSCGVGGTCRHMPIHERCTDPAAPMCDPARGCVAGTGCRSDADCADAHACTLDTCGADRTCRHMPIHERCTGAGEMCSPTMGCYVPRPCSTATECQDGIFCNGAEVCMPEFGCAPAERPRVCDDSNPCTRDSCDSASDMCVFRCDPTLGPTCRDMCPPPSMGCNGRFALSGTARFGCGFCTEVDLSEATFEIMDGVLTVRSRGYRTMPPVPGGLVLTDTVEPLCPMFDASAEIGGGCVERYRIAGMFTDDDHFTATVEWRFIDMDGFSCTICGCVDGTGTVTGTRIP
jgi:hypothetical protein